jgi:hypothetical protein
VMPLFLVKRHMRATSCFQESRVCPNDCNSKKPVDGELLICAEIGPVSGR